MEGFDVVIPGTGTVPIAPGIRAGILLLTTHDFGDGTPVPATCLVIDHPDSTSRMEWLKVGSTVRVGRHGWQVSAIEGDRRATGSVTLAFVGELA